MPHRPGALFATLSVSLLFSGCDLLGGEGDGPGSVLGPPSILEWNRRPYAVDSPWNTPIGADAAVDPESEAMVATIAASSNGLLRSDPTQYTYPVYLADTSTPRTTLTCTGIVSTNDSDGGTTFASNLQLRNVPIPEGALPAEGADAQIIVIDLDTGDEYDIYQFEPPDRCRNVTRYVRGVYRDGVEPSYISRGAGIPYLAGLIRPWEIEEGRIEHALAFGYALTRQGRCVWPASKTDGTADSPDALPQGARFRLDPAVEVDRIEGLDALGRNIARALQEYGAIVVDNSGANKLYAEEHRTAGWDGRLVATTISAIPVDRLQVLRLPDAYRDEAYTPSHGRCVR